MRVNVRICQWSGHRQMLQPQRGKGAKVAKVPPDSLPTCREVPGEASCSKERRYPIACLGLEERERCHPTAIWGLAGRCLAFRERAPSGDRPGDVFGGNSDSGQRDLSSCTGAEQSGAALFLLTAGERASFDRRVLQALPAPLIPRS